MNIYISYILLLLIQLILELLASFVLKVDLTLYSILVSLCR